MNKPIKTKEVLAIEKKLKPKSVFFSKSRCCGDSWFMDFNYLERVSGEPSWRISHNLKTKRLHLVSYKPVLVGAHVQSLRFKTPRELFNFIKKYLD